MLGSVLEGFGARAPGLAWPQAAALGHGLFGLVAACIGTAAAAAAPSGRRAAQMPPLAAEPELAQVRRYIERHAADPALNPERLCAAFGLSRAALHRLFRPGRGRCGDRPAPACGHRPAPAGRSGRPLRLARRDRAPVGSPVRAACGAPSSTSTAYRPRSFGERPLNRRMHPADTAPGSGRCSTPGAPETNKPAQERRPDQPRHPDSIQLRNRAVRGP